ncbi:MAG: FMN-dependent NADH-azoreductase, partial [Burkholderiaceae bacterium]|nr:FMN-dependent NADH-azoreductase [Burkholderiaceae bacterium]
TSSIFGEHGESSKLVERLVKRFEAQGAKIARRNVTQNIPHVDAARFKALTSPADQLDDAQRSVVAFSNALIAELQAADTIILAAPMYNFSIPSQLKSYFDHVARAGITFKYTEQGPVGLLQNKKVYVMTTRGGFYKDTPNDLETPYLKNLLGFLGLTNLEIIYVEGIGISAEQKAQAVKAAEAEVDALKI